MRNNTLVFIPTYNESENAQKIYKEIKDLNMDADILFIDDNSPDGTGRILDSLARKDDSVSVIHRKSRMGVGSAHMEGITYAYKKGYKILITMDCDFTHKTEYMKEFLKYASEYDLVVGSRYLAEGSLEEWNLYRRSLTRLAHFLTRLILGMPYDATGSYRLYKLDRIEPDIFKDVTSAGYSFFFESLYLLSKNHLKIKEIPIELPKRTYGHSKMRMRDITASIFKLSMLYLTIVNRKQDCV